MTEGLRKGRREVGGGRVRRGKGRELGEGKEGCC